MPSNLFDLFGSTEYAAAVRIAVDVVDGERLPMELRKLAFDDAAARLGCAPEDRLPRLIQLLSFALAAALAGNSADETPEAALRRFLLVCEGHGATPA